MVVDGSEEIMLISHNGIAIRMECTSISHIGRSTHGVRVMRLGETDYVAAAAKIASEEVENATTENEEESTEPSEEVMVEQEESIDDLSIDNVSDNEKLEEKEDELISNDHHDE